MSNLSVTPQKFIFQNQEVDFEIFGSNVMVNATQMAKIFNSKVEAFTRNEDTKRFIFECLKSENSRFLLVEKEEDLVISVQKSGTWMHRILALKFAEWLSPAFELWIYQVIDEILFGHYKQLEELLQKSAANRNRIDELREELRSNPTFTELETLELQDKQYQRLRAVHTGNQLKLFRTLKGYE